MSRPVRNYLQLENGRQSKGNEPKAVYGACCTCNHRAGCLLLIPLVVIAYLRCLINMPAVLRHVRSNLDDGWSTFHTQGPGSGRAKTWKLIMLLMLASMHMIIILSVLSQYYRAGGQIWWRGGSRQRYKVVRPCIKTAVHGSFIMLLQGTMQGTMSLGFVCRGQMRPWR